MGNYDAEYPEALSASTLINDKVRNMDGDDLGTLKEIMIDLSSGRVAYAVLSFGGILGMGDKLFAIPWEALSVDTVNKEIILDVPQELLEHAPGFDKDDWPGTADRDWLVEIYRYYDYKPYWE